MTLDEDRIAVLLRDADENPPRGPRVDLARARREGRRRRRRRRVAVTGVAALATVLAAGTLPMFLHHDRKAAPPAVPPPPPTTCTVSALPLPEGSIGGTVRAGDPTGRWLIGTTGRSGSNQETPVLWDGDRVTALPETFSPHDVNASGAVVGFVEDGSTGGSYVYREGRLEPLAGTDSMPRLVNDAGTVVGERVFARKGVAVTVPVRWRALTGKPEDLPLPGPGWEGTVDGLDEDGTMVGTVHDAFAPSSYRGYLWHADGTGEFLPVPVTPQGKASAFWPVSVRDGWVVGTMRRAVPGSMVTAAMRLNLRTGAFTPLPEPAEFYPLAGTARGWALGTLSNEAERVRAALLTDDRVLELPEPEAGRAERDPMPAAVSDDGRTIVGTHRVLDSRRADHAEVPVRWRCR